MCTPHAKQWKTIHGIPKGYLSVDTWELITTKLRKEKVCFDHIIFQWLGDPSLHPNLPKLVELAVANLADQVNYLRIDTNGILLTRDTINELCKLSERSTVPILMVFTIDACTRDVYETVKGGDFFFRALKNIRYLIRQRRSSGESAKLNIQLQFVVQESNAHQTQLFLDYWSDLLYCQGGFWYDEVMFKRLSVDGGAAGQAKADELYQQSVIEAGIQQGRYRTVNVSVWEQRPWQNDDKNHGQRTACPALWMTPVIRHDGHLLMCCADLQGELTLGSLLDSSFLQLWHGNMADDYRDDHLNGRFKGVCEGCGGINWYNLRAEQIQSHQQRMVRRKEASK